MANKYATEDFWKECYLDQKISPKEFQQRFCAVCKNQECHRAEWGESRWLQRVSTQEDRLLTNPNFADPRDPKYRHIREHDFPSLLREAIRIEVIEQKADWSIPTEADITAAVSEKGVNVHSELPLSSPTQDEKCPKSETPEIPQESVGVGDGENPKKFVESEPSEKEKPKSEIKPTQKKVTKLFTNTPFPKEGLMVDGTKPLTQKQDSSQQSVRQPSRFTLDSWTSPEVSKPKNIVKKGARIQMGGQKPPESKK